jgi:hypothetical protein
MSELSTPCYALPPFSIHAIDANSIMLVRSDTGAVAAIDARWRHFLGALQTFRTLSDHAREIVRIQPELQGQEAALEQALQQLIPRQVFYSSTELLTQLQRADTENHTQSITVCIRTCDRPERLGQLLASLVENAQTHGNTWRYEICDDSKNTSFCEHNRQLATDYSTQLTIDYYGRAEQQHFCQTLIARQPQHADTLQWLLSADHPLNQNVPTYGLLYNHVLLRYAGTRVLLLDDDALLQAWGFPETHWHPQFGPIPGISRVYTDFGQAQNDLQRFDYDPIALHAQTLGVSLPVATQQLAQQALSAQCCNHVPLANTVHPTATKSIINYTLNGLLGDTGTFGDHALLWRGRNLIADVLSSDTRYQQFYSAPRCAFNGTSRPLCTNSAYFHHTTCAGIDLSTLTPPVIPTERGEDTLLGTLLRYLYPHNIGLRLPFGMPHRPHDARPWIFDAAAWQPDFSAANLLTILIQQLRAPADLSAPAKLALLQETIHSVSDHELGLAHHLSTLAQVNWHTHLIQDFATLQYVLGQKSSFCAQWRQDITTLRTQALTQLQQPRLLQASEFSQQAVLIQRYAMALPVWQTAYSEQCELNR